MSSVRVGPVPRFRSRRLGRFEPHQARLLRVDRQAVLAHPLGQDIHDSLGVVFSGYPDHESSSPGEFHPQALTEPDGSLSTHPALITRPGPRLPARFLPIAGLT